MELTEELIRPFAIAVVLNEPTEKIVRWARTGLLPGAVFVGTKVWFRRAVIEQFFAGGGTPTIPEKAERFRVARHGGRDHASGRPHTDRTARPNDDRLAAMVKPDPGVRDYAMEI